MFVSVRMQLPNHVNTTTEVFQPVKGLCDVYRLRY